MDPVRAATAIVASPACGLAVAASIVAAEAFEVAAVVVAVVAAVAAGKRRES
jgi:hypothetical protein